MDNKELDMMDTQISILRANGYGSEQLREMDFTARHNAIRNNCDGYEIGNFYHPNNNCDEHNY
jgi:hypothetical protein